MFHVLLVTFCYVLFFRVLISYSEKLYKNIWAKAASVNEVKRLIHLSDLVSIKNNTLSVYFIAAKMLGKDFNRNICIFTTL